MSTLSIFSKRAAIALMIASVTLPAAAFEPVGDLQAGGNGPPDPGPGNWGGPGDFAAPSGGGTGGGVSSGGDGHSIAAQRNNECPNGNLVVDYRMDSDGHPIPASFTRTCVPFR